MKTKYCNCKKAKVVLGNNGCIIKEFCQKCGRRIKEI